jgi:predicted enzyme related to lactoylglutathione lyase
MSDHAFAQRDHMTAPRINFLVNIDVADLPGALDFYTRAFDLTVGRQLGGEVVEMLGGSAPIYLLAKRAGTRPTTRSGATRSYDRHWTPIHLDFVVPEIEAAVQKASSAGAVVEGEIEVHAWGKLALMADPFGNGFCLLQFIGRGYDEIDSGAVV